MTDHRLQPTPVQHSTRLRRLLGVDVSPVEVYARVLGAFYAGAGAAHLSNIDGFLFDHWHLPTWVRLFTGAFELLAGLLTIVRSTRAAGAVGIAMAMAGATVLHVVLGEVIAAPFTALLAAAALPVGYWYRSEDPLSPVRAAMAKVVR